ncbi:FHA domain-containing protein [Actinoplanes sp. RD1]|uniref:FHA domain-containing protein n=1 Tax=Actinoplanes sp. RD1 TaxID=3064538 RepID=UPI0027424559|nr:FHA domain-containing protein [Actinoplanes sp. RD1]
MTAICPKGHESGTDDFCDVCGAKIGAPAPVPAAAPDAAAAAPAAGGEPCPNCGMPRLSAGRFCEDCGYDHQTGKVPVLSPAAPAQAPQTDAPSPGPAASPSPGATAAPATAAFPARAAEWTATVAADRDYFEANGIEGVDFPDKTSTREVTLTPPQLRIGRRSVAKGTTPDIDLSEDDPGVSHHQALLTQSVSGVWLVADLGSTNGTYLNDEQTPLPEGHSRPLADGDRVHVGAWTTITLHAPE